jgi:hypothetical protein
MYTCIYPSLVSQVAHLLYDNHTREGILYPPPGIAPNRSAVGLVLSPLD